MNNQAKYATVRMLYSVGFMLLAVIFLLLVAFILAANAQQTITPPLRVSETNGNNNLPRVYWLKFPIGSLTPSGTTMTVNVPSTGIANTWQSVQTFAVPPIFTGFTSGRLPLFGTNGVLSSNADLTYDAANNWLRLGGTNAGVIMKNPTAGGEWGIYAQVFQWSGKNDESICNPCYNYYSNDLTQPRFGYNYEPIYKDGSPPNGLLEINLNFEGLPDVNASGGNRENYRPETWNINLNNNQATKGFSVYRFSLWNKSSANPVLFDAYPDSHLIQVNGKLQMNGIDPDNSTLLLQGTAANTSFATFTPSAVRNGYAIVSANAPTHTGYLYGFHTQGAVSQGLIMSVYNTDTTHNTADAKVEISTLSANSGSPFITYNIAAAGSSWATGLDNADNDKFKLNRDYRIGYGTVQEWDTDGNSKLFGNFTLQNKYFDIGSMTAPASPSTGTRRLYVDSSTNQLTLKKADGTTVNLESGTGSQTITNFPDIRYFPAAVCNGMNAASAFDLPVSAALQPDCVIGTNTVKGVLNAPDSGAFSGMVSLLVPSDYTVGSNVDVKVTVSTPSVTGNVKLSLASAFAATDGSEGDDPSFNAANTQTVAAPAQANRNFTVTFSAITTTGIGAGKRMYLKVSRDGQDAADTIGDVLRIIGIEVTVRRTLS